MKFKKGVKRAEISNAIDNFVNGTVGKDMPLDFFQSMWVLDVPIRALNKKNQNFTWNASGSTKYPNFWRTWKKPIGAKNCPKWLSHPMLSFRSAITSTEQKWFVTMNSTCKRQSCRTVFFQLQSGVSYIGSPSGSTNDADVINACNDHGIVLAHTNLRLFHH